jgi:hypothetical protein
LTLRHFEEAIDGRSVAGTTQDLVAAQGPEAVGAGDLRDEAVGFVGETGEQYFHFG